jgi:phage anti-repressor protein
MNNFNKELALTLIDSSIEFPVDLDDAMQWWDCRTKDGSLTTRRQLVAKLKQNFDQGLDWTFAQIYEKVQTGRPVDKIYLTVDTFKEMGMMLPSGKGKEIRRYFLECERELKQLRSESAQTQTVSSQPTPRDIADFVSVILNIAGLDQSMIAASAANHVAKYYPALRPSAEDLKKELVIETSEKLLTPTELGLILEQRTGQKHSAQRVNKLLSENGLQTPNPNGKDPAWVPTPKGSEFSKLLLAAQKGVKDATRQHLQWFESVVDVLAV